MDYHTLRKKELRDRIADLQAIKKRSKNYINKLYINKEIVEYNQLIEEINTTTEKKRNYS